MFSEHFSLVVWFETIPPHHTPPQNKQTNQTKTITKQTCTKPKQQNKQNHQTNKTKPSLIPGLRVRVHENQLYHEQNKKV